MDEYIKIISEKLDEKRVLHCVGVAKTAVELAMKNGVDPKKAHLAGILHDYAKNISPKELIKIAKESRLIIDEVEFINPYLLHGPVGAYLIQEELDIKDPEIIEAVRYHTTGKPNMGKLAQIIYIADLIEPNRSYPSINQLRKVTYDELTLGLLEGLNLSIRHVLEEGKAIHTLSIQTRNWLLGNSKTVE